VAGNGVIEAAAEVGITKVRIVEAEGDEIVAVRRRGLTEAQKLDYALTDNRANELSEWDKDVLKDISEEMDIGHLFTKDEQTDLLGEEASGDAKISPR
jgi:hypothetical protein